MLNMKGFSGSALRENMVKALSLNDIYEFHVQYLQAGDMARQSR
jgi:hypothetical protein